MSHGGGGGFGHSGGHHGGHGGHHSGGHPDQSPNWNSALQGERPGGKFITSLPNPTIVPIFLAIGVFLLMLAPFVIEWDYDSLPWVKHSTEEAAAPSQPDASVQADRDLLDATKNSMLQAQANIRAEAARQRSLPQPRKPAQTPKHSKPPLNRLPKMLIRTRLKLNWQRSHKCRHRPIRQLKFSPSLTISLT